MSIAMDFQPRPTTSRLGRSAEVGVTTRCRWAMQGICLVALALSVYLAWTAMTATKAFGCGGGVFDCSHVLNSRWSTWFGIPVGVLSAGLYLATLLILLQVDAVSPRFRTQSWMLVAFAAFSAGLAALWFTSLQIFRIGHLCPWCLATHACGLIFAGLVMWQRPVDVIRIYIVGVMSLAGLMVLIGGQMMASEPDHFQIETQHGEVDGSVFSPDIDEDDATSTESVNPEGDPAPTSDATTPRLDNAGLPWLVAIILLLSLVPNQVAGQTTSDSKTEPNTRSVRKSDTRPQRLVSASGINTNLDMRQWPFLGEYDAKYTVVEMFDYTCPHCRNTHLAIKGAFEKHQGKFAVIALPVPLDTACNSAVQVTGPKQVEACEIARIAVAVWRLKPTEFHRFHNWLFEPEHGRTATEARQQAAKLVGNERLTEELSKPNVAKYIAKNVELYKRAGAGQVPKLLFPKSTLVGEINSPESLWSTIETESQK